VKDARNSMKSTRAESRRRTNAARDALAGRTPRRRWTVMVGLIGVGIGAAAGAIGALLSRRNATADQIEAALSNSDLSGTDLPETNLPGSNLSDTASAGVGAPAANPIVADKPPVITSPTPVTTPVATSVPVTPQVAGSTAPITYAAAGKAKPGLGDKAGVGKPLDGTTSVNGSTS
jgi:pentapeptide repeat protein